MELSDLDKYKNQIFNIAVIILAAFIAFNFIYKKQLQEIGVSKRRQVAEEEKNRVLEDISQLEIKINTYRNLLTKKDTSAIIEVITNMAKEAEVKIVSIKPGREQEYPDYIKSAFELLIEVTNYHALGKFISKLENYQDPYIVDGLDIISSTEVEGLRINLKINNIVFAK